MEGFSLESTGVRFRNLFWIIGGHNSCLGTSPSAFGWDVDVTKGQGNKHSYLWNIKKRKWIQGPEYAKITHYTFKSTCALTLNASSVLFVGLLRLDLPVYLNEFYNQYPNSYTAIYNFDTKKWIEQEKLFTTWDENMYFTYNTACTVEQNKSDKRSLYVMLESCMNNRLSLRTLLLTL